MTPAYFRNTIGLDISDLKLRCFEFEAKAHHKKKIRACGEIDVPPGTIVEGEIKSEPIVVDLLKKLLTKPTFGKISSKYTNVSLPEKKIFTKVISIPNVPDEEMKGAVSWGIEQNIPVSMDQIYFDWQLLNTKKKEQSDKLTIIAGVAPRNIVDSYTKILSDIGYTVVGMENESIAIARCLVDQEADVQDPLLIVDLGKSRTNITIFAKNAVQFTSTIDVNGVEMTKRIADQLHITFEDAEKAKIICGLDRRKGRGAVRQILEPILIQLADKISESLDYYRQYMTNQEKINTVILTGSVSKMVGLPKFLQERLKITAIIGDPWSNISRDAKMQNKLDKQFGLYSFTTAIGLALKEF